MWRIPVSRKYRERSNRTLRTKKFSLCKVLTNNRFLLFFWQVIQVQSRCCSVSNFFKARFKYRMFHEHNFIQIRRTSFDKKYSCLIGRWSNNSLLIHCRINVKIPEHAITLIYALKSAREKLGIRKSPAQTQATIQEWMSCSNMKYMKLLIFLIQHIKFSSRNRLLFLSASKMWKAAFLVC